MIRLRTLLRVVAAFIIVVALVWGAGIAVVYAAMRQPPERFGAFMARVPRMAMIAIPFKPLWMSARRGALQAGDLAPDFTLPALHGDQKVTLSQEYKRRPVVLVFGSYT